MIARWPCMGVTVFGSMLAVNTPEAAECAWVLWTTSFKLSGGAPVAELVQPDDAFTAKAECSRATSSGRCAA